jgi:hypothetical protein
MLIIGCDFHTRYQQIAMAEDQTGELLLERRLDHESGEAHAFYRSLPGPVRVGIEATGPIPWFERLLRELGHELWIGDSAKIRASEGMSLLLPRLKCPLGDSMQIIAERTRGPRPQTRT